MTLVCDIHPGLELPPGDTYVRHWPGLSLVKIFVAFSAPSHYLNQCWSVSSWTGGNKIQWHFNPSANIGLLPVQHQGIIWASADVLSIGPGGRFKNAYELLDLRALKISMLYKNRIFQCMGKIFCVEFQRVPLKFHTKYLIHTLKNVDFIQGWRFKSS